MAVNSKSVFLGAIIAGPALYLAVFAVPRSVPKWVWSTGVLGGLSLSFGTAIAGIVASHELEEALPLEAAVKAANREVFVSQIATQAVAQIQPDLQPSELQPDPDPQPGELQPIPATSGIG